MKGKKGSTRRKKETQAKCPLCTVIDTLKDKMEENSDIIEHFTRAKTEVLEGFRKIIEKELDVLKGKKKKKDFSKVNVTDQ